MKPDGQWEFKQGNARSEIEDLGEEGQYSTATFEIYLRRRPRFIVLNVIVPCFLMTFLSALVFVIPPAAGEKVTYSMSVLLAFTVFLLIVSTSMPRTSVYMPLIGKIFPRDQYYARTDTFEHTFNEMSN